MYCYFDFYQILLNLTAIFYQTNFYAKCLKICGKLINIYLFFLCFSYLEILQSLPATFLVTKTTKMQLHKLQYLFIY